MSDLGSYEGSLRAWRSARSLRDLGELTSKWVLGELYYHPVNAGPPDPETLEIATDLSILNRRGLVTIFSQPAAPIDESGFGQRAAVEALTTKRLARRVSTLTLHSDLIVMAFPPATTGGEQIPITTDRHRPFSWCGGVYGTEDIEPLSEVCSRVGAKLLLTAWRIIAIDPKWGRRRLLWNQLRQATHPSSLTAWSITPADPSVEDVFRPRRDSQFEDL